MRSLIAADADDGGDPAIASNTVSSSSNAFALLLSRLADLGEAGERRAGAMVYEVLRRKLIVFFRLHAPVDAEALSDETLDRLARRLFEGVAVEDPRLYALGIARHLLEEHRRRLAQQRPDAEAIERLAPIPLAAPDAIDDAAQSIDQALSKCLATLAPEDCGLILDYYSGDDRQRIRVRQQLAARLGLKLNALRNRALRLRSTVEACLRLRLQIKASASTAERSA